MPSVQDEVAAFFAEAERCPLPEGMHDETLSMLARAARKAFKDEDIRRALWFFMVDHPLAFVLRPAVLNMHSWFCDELRKHAS